MAAKLGFCLYENRRSAEPGVRLAILSLQRQCPDAAMWVFLAEPSPEIRAWLARFPTVELKTPSWPAEDSWNNKPAALLALLDGGFDEAVWLDSDLIVASDLRAELARGDAATLVVAQDVYRAKQQGTRWRAVAWSLEPGREFGCMINSCVVRATERHRPLLEAWWALLRRPDYRAEQRRPPADRAMHFVGDQDALGALLGSGPWMSLPVRLLRSGADIVHNGPYFCYGWRERLARLASGRTLLVHGLREKAWERGAVEPADLGATIFTLLDHEISVYLVHARRLSAEAELSGRWLESRVSWRWRLLSGGFGPEAWRGSPFLLCCRIAKLCGFNFFAAKLGKVARVW